MKSFPFVNRGLVPPATYDRPARQLILVQQKDAEGFWCNVSEPLTVKSALKSAEALAREERAETRVCTGPKRDVVRVFGI